MEINKKSIKTLPKIVKTINNLKKILASDNKEMKRLSWDEYFMSIAFLAKSRSPCTRLHVGCVLVKNNKLIGTGYNGFLPGAPHESIIENNHERATIHAEVNALANTTEKIKVEDNVVAYITHSPCHECVKSLLANGVRIIKYYDTYKNVSSASLKLISDVNAKIIDLYQEKQITV